MAKNIYGRKRKNVLICTFLFVGIALVLLGIIGIFSNGFKSAFNKPIKDKTISFLGDEITTYDGWSNNTFYNSTIGENLNYYDDDNLSSVNFSYWKKSIDDLKLNLVVNNSYSTSCVTGIDVANSGTTRCTNLHNNANVKPDIIVVNLGINDFKGNVALGEFKYIDEIYDSKTKTYIGDLTKFSNAYATMVHKILNKYESADLYLCTLLPDSKDCDTKKLEKYNDIIRYIASVFDCNIVDFYKDIKITKKDFGDYSIDTDNFIPNINGMDLLYSSLRKSLLTNYKKGLLK